MQSNGCWHGGGRKARRAAGLKEDIDRPRATITMKIVTTPVLLATPTGYVGFYSLLTLLHLHVTNHNNQFISCFYNCIVQQQALLYVTNEAIEDSKTEIKNVIKGTT